MLQSINIHVVHWNDAKQTQHATAAQQMMEKVNVSDIETIFSCYSGTRSCAQLRASSTDKMWNETDATEDHRDFGRSVWVETFHSGWYRTCSTCRKMSRRSVLCFISIIKFKWSNLQWLLMMWCIFYLMWKSSECSETSFSVVWLRADSMKNSKKQFSIPVSVRMCSSCGIRRISFKTCCMLCALLISIIQHRTQSTTLKNWKKLKYFTQKFVYMKSHTGELDDMVERVNFPSINWVWI